MTTLNASTAFAAYSKSFEQHRDLGSLGFQYVWLESPVDTLLERAARVGNWTDLAVWPRGRAFGLRAEYRWRHSNTGLHVVLVSDDGHMPTGFKGRVELQLDRTADLILWGDVASFGGDDTECIANEIPRVLGYPMHLTEQLSKEQTLRLTVHHYSAVEPATEGLFQRCAGFTIRGRLKRDATCLT